MHSLRCWSGKPERFVELGLGLFASVVVAADVLLFYGRLVGEAARRGRHHAAPPLAGEVPPDRCENISGNSAR